MTSSESHNLNEIIKYSKKYEISIQFWPEQKAVYIMKDGVDLWSIGAHDLEYVLSEAVKYLNRINRKQ